MKISIIGAGAMGSLYGGKIAAAGYEVLLYDIATEHVERINRSGLEIETISGERTVYRPRASSDLQTLKGADILIIFVKSAATEAAALQVKDLVDRQTIVLTLQNGVGNEEILRRIFGASRTAAGVTSQGATFLGPGRVRHLSRPAPRAPRRRLPHLPLHARPAESQTRILSRST